MAGEGAFAEGTGVARDSTQGHPVTLHVIGTDPIGWSIASDTALTIADIAPPTPDSPAPFRPSG